MKKILFAFAGLVAALAVACSGTSLVPTAMPTNSAVSQHPTLGPTQEWTLMNIAVDNYTVTVSLTVFAGIGVGMTLDGERPNWVEEPIPVMMFMFECVAPGAHAIEIKDVAMFAETASVSVEAPLLPIWLAEWVEDLESGNA